MDRETLLLTMAIMAVADGKVLPDEVKILRRIFHQLTGQGLKPGDIESALESAGEMHEGIVTHLVHIRPSLDETMRQMIMEAAHEIARADQIIDEAEKELLIRYGEALGMDEQHIDDMIEGFWGNMKRPTFEI